MAQIERHDCGFLEDVVEDGRVSFVESQRQQYSQDASPHEPSLPDAVVWPSGPDEVSRVLSAANGRGVPVTPWSGGSGLEGNAIPVAGGVVLNMSNLTDIDVRPADLQAVVGAGVVYDELNEALSSYGLRFPPGISSGHLATVGGMIATNASGFNAVRYGETRDHVRRLEVVLADGRVIECGRNVVKTSSGYSLKDLFVGSEGTLGVVTEATLALTGIPQRKHAALVTFATIEDACQAVSEIIGGGLKPGALEFMDPTTIELINAYSGVGLPVEPTLIIELHANNSGIGDDIEFAESICEANGARTWEAAAGGDMDEIWQARREAYDATRAYREGLDIGIVGDIVVPISHYPDIVTTVAAYSDELDLMCPCLGHAGDGNLHYTPLVDPTDQDMVDRAHDLNERVIDAALELGGTATGEHGVGVGKRQFMAREHGEALEVMRAVKTTIDPNGILNPGKIFPSK